MDSMPMHSRLTTTLHGGAGTTTPGTGTPIGDGMADGTSTSDGDGTADGITLGMTLGTDTDITTRIMDPYGEEADTLEDIGTTDMYTMIARAWLHAGKAEEETAKQLSHEPTEANREEHRELLPDEPEPDGS